MKEKTYQLECATKQYLQEKVGTSIIVILFMSFLSWVNIVINQCMYFLVDKIRLDKIKLVWRRVGAQVSVSIVYCSAFVLLGRLKVYLFSDCGLGCKKAWLPMKHFILVLKNCLLKPFQSNRLQNSLFLLSLIRQSYAQSILYYGLLSISSFFLTDALERKIFFHFIARLRGQTFRVRQH